MLELDGEGGELEGVFGHWGEDDSPEREFGDDEARGHVEGDLGVHRRPEEFRAHERKGSVEDGYQTEARD